MCHVPLCKPQCCRTLNSNTETCHADGQLLVQVCRQYQGATASTHAQREWWQAPCMQAKEPTSPRRHTGSAHIRLCAQSGNELVKVQQASALFTIRQLFHCCVPYSFLPKFHKDVQQQRPAATEPMYHTATQMSDSKAVLPPGQPHQLCRMGARCATRCSRSPSALR